MTYRKIYTNNFTACSINKTATEWWKTNHNINILFETSLSSCNLRKHMESWIWILWWVAFPILPVRTLWIETISDTAERTSTHLGTQNELHQLPNESHSVWTEGSHYNFIPALQIQYKKQSAKMTMMIQLYFFFP